MTPGFEKKLREILLNYISADAINRFIEKGDEASILKDSGIKEDELADFLDAISIEFKIAFPDDPPKNSSFPTKLAWILSSKTQYVFPDLTISQIESAAQRGMWTDEFLT